MTIDEKSPDTDLLPVMRPRLPRAAAIAPYLEEVDTNRWYSNFGPLACRFEDRLCAHFASGQGSVVAVSNGTIGLTLALRAVEEVPGTLCMLPGFTFSASASAVLAAGLVPWFVDVDPTSWALEPENAKRALSEAPGKVAAVMPVSVFGRPVDVGAWDDFAEDTGISVVIDGAASFAGAPVGKSPVVISLHGTKIFGVGEGGLVLSGDRDLITRVRSLSNFGFPMTATRTAAGRSAVLPGFNGKLSEYAAAVGLAGLDDWTATRAGFVTLRDSYLRILDGVAGLKPQPGGDEPWVSATINFSLPGGGAGALETDLAGRGIQSRRWWGEGCHKETAFQDCPRSDLPVTERLAETVIGLPFFPDMGIDDIFRVKQAIAGYFA